MTQNATLTQDNTSQSTTTTQDNTPESNLTFRQCLIQEMNACDRRQIKYENIIVGEKDEKEIIKLLLLIDVAALGRYILQTQIHADQSSSSLSSGLCKYFSSHWFSFALHSTILREYRSWCRCPTAPLPITCRLRQFQPDLNLAGR